MTEPLKPAGFYGRVSNRDEESIDAQLEVAREKARADGYYIPDAPGFQYADVHVRGVTESRPGMDTMERWIEGGRVQFDRVYIREMKRLGRWKDPRLHDFYAVKWERKGVHIRYCDKDGPTGFSEGFQDRDVGLYMIDKVDHIKAARDRTDIEQQLRRARRRRLINAFLPAGRPQYGLVRVLVDKRTREVVRVLEPGEHVKIKGHRVSLRCGDESEIETVRYIFDGVEGGRSLAWLAAELNRRRVPPPGALWSRNSRKSRGEAGLKWYPNTVGRIATNEIYAGVFTYGDREAGPPISPEDAKLDQNVPIRVENFYPDPPITREQYARVQDALKGRRTLWDKRRATKPKYLLSGKIRCSVCKSTIGGKRPHRSRGHRVYSHWRYLRKGQDQLCPGTSKTVSLDLVESAVLGQLRAVLADPRLAELVRNEIRECLGPGRHEQDARRMRTLRGKIRTAQQQLDRAAEAVLKSTSKAGRERMQRACDEQGARVDQLESELAELEEREGRALAALDREVWLVGEAPELLRLLDEGSFELRRAVVERVVEYVEYDFDSGRLEMALLAA